MKQIKKLIDENGILPFVIILFMVSIALLSLMKVLLSKYQKVNELYEKLKEKLIWSSLIRTTL